MENQERYNEWKSLISSKKISESVALTSGIGPQFGLDKVIIKKESPSGVFDISLKKKTITEGNLANYITNNINVIQQTEGAIITPDGILTNLLDEVYLTSIDTRECFEFEDSDGNSFREAIIIASHLYVEDEELRLGTTFSSIPNKSNLSLSMAIVGTDDSPLPNMATWLNHPSIFNVLLPNKEVIIGVISFYSDDSILPKIELPYHYQWPQPVVVPKRTWDNLISELSSTTQLITNINTYLSTHTVPKRSVIMWSGTYLEDFPNGYLFCGKWFIGRGSDSSISKPNGDITSMSAQQTLINTLNSKYGLTGSNRFTLLKVTVNGQSDYYFKFDGVTVNGVTLPDMTRRFLVNVGYDIVGIDGDKYSVGDIGGSDKVILSMAEMPRHTHPVPLEFNQSGNTIAGISGEIDYSDTYHSIESGPAGGYGTDKNEAHENRPPYYAIAYLIKVI